MTPLPPEIQSAVEATKTAAGEAKEASDRWRESAEATAAAQGVAMAKQQGFWDAEDRLRALCSKSLGIDVDDVHHRGGSLSVMIHGRDMTYSEAVEWVRGKG